MQLIETFLVCVVTVVLTVIGTPAVMAQEPEITAPVPTVPGISTIEGLYTIIAYNSEGWVTMGYRTANDRQGDNWVMLEVGLTLRSPAEAQTLSRSSFTLTLPDGSTVPLPTQEEFLEAYQNGDVAFMPPSGDMSSTAGQPTGVLRIQQPTRDNIDYFPAEADQPCVFRFFSGPMTTTTQRTLPDDEFKINSRHACGGYLFFKLPEEKVTVPGDYWLAVDFAGSQVQVPFRIMTKEERKYFRKNSEDLKKGYEAFLKQEESEKAKQQG
jgi:hypothetical protein